MNSKTRLMFNLAYIHNYINDILDMCNELDNNYPVIFTDKKSQYAINMCFVQIGEHCAQIRDNNKSFYDNNELKLYQIKGMRDRIVHSYGRIDYDIIKESISKDIPVLKEKIENIVDKDILNNPYLLYETEYDDYICNFIVVKDIDEAIEHIYSYSTKHSESIITNNDTTAKYFMDSLDSACVYHNASTRFSDGGEFGFGAEVGISTQKLHARGPIGLQEMTSTKYLIYGKGQIR